MLRMCQSKDYMNRLKCLGSKCGRNIMLRTSHENVLKKTILSLLHLNFVQLFVLKFVHHVKYGAWVITQDRKTE